MKIMIVMACAFALAACGQTTGSARRAPALAEPAVTALPKEETQPRTVAARPPPKTAAADRCADAANRAVQAQTNAAMLGGALSMVGGLGGLGGRGGMIAAQAASVGGSVVQSQARAQAHAGMQECM